MAGVKGRSGRKTRYREAQDGNLEKLARGYLIDNFPTFDGKTKLKVALSIMSRITSQKIDSNVTVEQVSEDTKQEIYALAQDFQRRQQSQSQLQNN